MAEQPSSPLTFERFRARVASQLFPDDPRKADTLLDADVLDSLSMLELLTAIEEWAMAKVTPVSPDVTTTENAYRYYLECFRMRDLSE